MRLVVAIAIVLLVGIAVVGAGALRGDSDDGGDLAFTPDPPSTGSAIGVASVMGSSAPSTDGDWTASVTLTVTDASDTVVESAVVKGAWSDGASEAGCTTAADGTCTFESTHSASTASADAVWTLTTVAKDGHAAAEGNTSKVTCTDPSRAANRDVDGTTPCDAVGTL
ncbi:MAG: hypothetical protein QOD30_1530 [Actinomycetota bacterium]|nr:hypothetical protein [Actinomycetota bacterium]